MLLMLIGVLGLGITVAQSQTLLNSWENSLEGWSIIETGTWTSVGFSTTKGASQGSYSWELSATGVDYGATLQGPSSASLTLLMANADTVTMTLVVGPNAPQFNWGIQIDLGITIPGVVTNMSLDGGIYPGGIFGGSLTDGSTNLVTWPITQAARTFLNSYPNLPASLVISFGGGGGGNVFIDKLQVNKIPQVQAKLSVRELFDGLGSDKLPANVAVSNLSSSLGFASENAWTVNPAQVNNCTLMAFRTLATDEPVQGSLTIGLPMTLDGTFGSLVQENSGFSFFPGAGGKTFWTDGDFMTRQLAPENFINFQATGEYWFSATISDRPWDGSAGSLYSQYVVFPSSGWGGFGFANGTTTNADFVAIGATGLDVHYGPTNVSFPFGETNASKALYISQGTLGQPGNVDTTLSANTNYYSAGQAGLYSQTNYSGGPYHINSLGIQTVGHVKGDYIVLLGRLKTFGDGTATVDAKYYGVGVGGNPWNTDLDINPASITWDASHSFNFSGTMTRLLLFQNGQFPFYIYGVRAGTNLASVVGIDPAYIQVAPLASTFVGYPINMTNLAVEANSYSWAPANVPAGYGSLTYQWAKNGTNIGGATQRFYNIASATTGDTAVYSCVATDPSGTWPAVSNSIAITVTQLDPPKLTNVVILHDRTTFVLTFDQPNLNGLGDLTHYVLDNGVTPTNVTVINKALTTEVQIRTTRLPLGTKIALSVTGVTNVVGGTLGTTNFAMWTDLVRAGAANWDAWLYPAVTSQNDYFNNFTPNNAIRPILQSMSLTSWAGPTAGITIHGNNGFDGDGYGDKIYGWFIPPVTTNYVFYMSADDGGRLMLSTNEVPENLCVIACESLWHDANQWTNINDQFPGPGTPHRGDGTANAAASSTGYVWDNSVAGQSPATACIQNRSDQFIVAFYDSSGAPGGPPQAVNPNWATAASQVTDCVPVSMTNQFWPNRDINGQALIRLEAGKMYYMELEHVEIGGGQAETATYKIAGTPDPLSPSANILNGSVIAGTVPFTPTITIAQGVSGPVINYTGVLLSGTNLNAVTNVVAQSSGATAISLGGPSQYTPSVGSANVFYRTAQ